MDRATKKVAFLSIVAVLVLAILGLSIFFANKEPEKPTDKTGAQTINKTAEAGSVFVKDIYQGEMQIPKYNIPLNTYAVDDFHSDEKSGVVTYKNATSGKAATGIIVDGSNQTDIDWSQVKKSGVDFAILRVGYRDYITGTIIIEPNFQQNIKGALEVGLDVGVYFFSQSIREDEAAEEAQTVLNQIKNYQVKYPVLINWDYADRVKDQSTVRTKDMKGQDITKMVKAYCDKIKSAGYTAGYYATKSLGYETLDLTALSDFDMWYMEYQKAPAFYYDFKIWEYSISEENKFPGVTGTVRACLALKKYV